MDISEAFSSVESDTHNMSDFLKIISNIILLSWLLSGTAVANIENFDAAPGISITDHKIKRYQELANKGNAGAQHDLGVFYAKGWGIQQNDEKARSWFEKACRGGHEKACQMR